MFRTVSMMLAALVLVACGGSDNNAYEPPATVTPVTPAGPVISTITLISTSPSIPSDGSASATLNAFVRDASNNFVKGATVDFSADSGGLAVTQAVTDANGLATATLTSAGDPSRRTIKVTAKSGTPSISATASVDVTGTTLSLSGPASLVQGQQGTYTVSLANSASVAIPSTTVTLKSAKSNALSASSVTTDSTGRASFTLTASAGGADTLTATSGGVSTTQQITVNTDSFVFTTPARNTEVALNTPVTVTVNWQQGGANVSGQNVTFSTTRGTIAGSPTVAAVAGNASVTLQASSAGGAVITATSATGSTSQLPIEFVATTPAFIDVQPSAFTIGTSQTSTLTAIVRDVNNNLVKNQNVIFTLVDVTGGTLSIGSAITDSQGRAQTVYQSSNTTSANNGVQITAAIQGNSSITDSVNLTVARQQLFISVGTGNKIDPPNSAQYHVQYVIQVTDSNGNGVPNTTLSVGVLSQHYYKGRRVISGTSWATTVSAVCLDEDNTFGPGDSRSRNGILDPGEDNNSSGRIEAGNIVSVSPAAPVTDSKGFALIDIYYPQQYAFYLDVTLDASTAVGGTEYVHSTSFVLGGLATDFNDITVAPPGPTSPFGIDGTCSDTL